MSNIIDYLSESAFIEKTDELASAIGGFEITTNTITAAQNNTISLSFTGVMPEQAVSLVTSGLQKGSDLPRFTTSVSNGTITLTPVGTVGANLTASLECYVICGTYVKKITVQNMPVIIEQYPIAVQGDTDFDIDPTEDSEIGFSYTPANITPAYTIESVSVLLVEIEWQQGSYVAQNATYYEFDVDGDVFTIPANTLEAGKLYQGIIFIGYGFEWVYIATGDADE